jgi:alpha-N-arabinofuranosidase
MKTQLTLIAAMAISLGSLAAASVRTDAQTPQRLVATIDTNQTSVPVSKYVFGMFIEHIGSTMYSSIWAEMLDDRKFYFPITAPDPNDVAKPADFMARQVQLRKWRPVGADVVMDKNDPYVGDQSPEIQLDSTTPHGISQSGIALVKGKKYTGRIVLRGAPDTHVNIALIWGSGEKDRQVASIKSVSSDFKTYHFNFTSQSDSTDATLEITGTGDGAFHIGAVSLMPADNIDGFRPDTTALIAQIKSGMWRFGGNYISNYTWYDAIGDRDKRPPTFDHAWNAMQTNDIGLDEFAHFCKLIGVDPYISINAGFGDAHSAAEEVEYMNGSTSTRLGALRAKNGHRDPYGVKFWNIGNEPWGDWQLGRTDTKYFVLKHNEFAKAMRKVDPSITLIASGEMLEDGNVPGNLRTKNVGNLGPIYSTEADWTGSFLKSSWGNFDGIAEHWYATPGVRFDLDKLKTLKPEENSDHANVKIDQTLLEYARYPADCLRVKDIEWRGYQQRYPAMLDKKIFMSLDEYAYFGGDPGRGNNIKQVLGYGLLFNEMLRHTDFITMAAHTMGTSTISFTRTASTLNTLGLVFKLYSNTFPGSTPVAVSGNSPQPEPKYPLDPSKKGSGSATYPLDVYAALTPDGKFVNVAVVNATETAQTLEVNIPGAQNPTSLLQITADSLGASNRIGEKPQVELKEIPLSNPSNTVSVAPISVNIYRFPISK